MGPICYFDKSFLQSLSVDEAAIFSFLYKPHLTPIFFAESLADLSKEGTRRPPADIVGGLALRTSAMGRNINVSHEMLCASDLVRGDVEMRRVPVVGNLVPSVGGGKTAYVARPTPEALAMERWERGQFVELERDFARAWRAMVGGLDLKTVAEVVKSYLGDQRPKSLEEAARLARSLSDGRGSNFASIRLARGLYVPDQEYEAAIMMRWYAAGQPPLSAFAPYASHCAVIDTFFYLALSNGLIAPERPSNRIDIAYLYYLPFAMVFISNDKLHRRAAPLFMTDEQEFAWGPDVKVDLGKIEAYFASLPEETRKRGLFHVAGAPPKHIDGVTLRLWNRFMGRRRTEPRGIAGKKVDEIPQLADLQRRIEEAARNPREHGRSIHEADSVTMQYRMPRRMGRWAVLPSDIDSGDGGTVDIRSTEAI